MDSSAPAAMLSPQDVVRTVFDLVAAERYDEVAAYVDAEDLERLRPDAEAATRVPELIPKTADDWMRHDPELPRAVAEYYVRRAGPARAASALSRTFAGVDSAEELQALSTAQLLGRWLQAADPRWMLRQMLDEDARSSPEAADIPAVRRVVAGATLEEDDTAHVVFRSGFGSDLLPMLEVASLRRTAGGWRMRFGKHNFLGTMAFGISFGPGPGEE
ncbi:hypothetical protein [Longimicrobium terrae]|uniref:Uncharacterized protein YjiS (DUF1127 family) n=1 Tax=Longimicrobium terrae TaxID=1639882 RepID=A0A841GZ70_9BACT|nr:hypothetical protein [Longimicrobium terrae]MBB4636497.1 uncharacterized protein YjiS (DUF1127 family) [Longimicrobium terrae]MBB6070979.1 uncharacterized protein YjiS (DUF1127 family) [Longimicrobium terrae]NNC29001.1 hypothetical protein [Longimicrobium terrae]